MSQTSSPAKGPAVLIGPEGLKLRTATITETLGRPFRVEMEVVGRGKFLPSSEVLGQPMALEIDQAGGEPRFVHGFVSEFHYLGSIEPLLHTYRVVLRPWIWFLSRAVNCRVFSKATARKQGLTLSVPYIIKQVFSKYDYADFKALDGDAHAEKEFVVQYRESDLSFVTRLMEEEGIYYFFEHSKDRHTLVLCEPNHVHLPVEGFEALPYFPPDAQRQEQITSIERWEISSRVEANLYTAKDFNFEMASDPLCFTATLPKDHALGNLEVFDYPGEFLADGAGQQRVRLCIDEQRQLAESFAGRSNARSICSGTVLAMTDHPVPSNDGQYLIVSTVLRVAGHALSSADILNGVSQCDFVAMRHPAHFRLPRSTPKPQIVGAQTAIVVTRDEQEIDADSHGRVRVRFHWDRREQSAIDVEESSCPVRVSQLWAGSGFGGMHIPRKDQEVIVEFLEGDPDRPIITGRVYNNLNAVPYSLPKHLTQSGIKTSTVGGTLANYNELRFEDGKGKEEIYIQAERDKRVKVKRNRSATVGASDRLTVGADRTVTVQGNLVVHVGSKTGKYTLDAVDSIELRCGQSTIKLTPDAIEMKSTNISIEGTTLIDAKAGTIKLNS